MTRRAALAILSAAIALSADAGLAQERKAQKKSKPEARAKGAVRLALNACGWDPALGVRDWWGIVPDVGPVPGRAHSHSLKRVTLVISERDGWVDGETQSCAAVEGVPTGSSEPLIPLIRGMPLTERSLVSADLQASRFKEYSQEKSLVMGRGIAHPPTDETIEIRMGGKSYRLRHQYWLDDGRYRVSLGMGSQEQVLLDAKGHFDAATGFRIHWAGDLDGDGNLDLIVNAPSGGDDSTHLRLYLSSKAAPGKLVDEAAEDVMR
jgi:hypothetical protein